MAKRKVDGLSFRAGPTQSGVPTTSPPPSPSPVGGEIVPINTISVFLSRYWLLLAILMIPLVFALYRKRSALPKWFMRLMYLFRGL